MTFILLAETLVSRFWGRGSCETYAQRDAVTIGTPDLSGAKLNDTDLAKANLDGVNLSGTYLRGAQLHSAS